MEAYIRRRPAGRKNDGQEFLKQTRAHQAGIRRGRVARTLDRRMTFAIDSE
jgi:hypothetical protein